MNCPNCGNEIEDGAGSCSNCGCIISESPQDEGFFKKLGDKSKWPVIIAAVLLLLLMVSFLAIPGVNRMRYQSFLKAGNRYLTEMNYEEAVVAFTKAIRIEDKEAAAYFGRGNAYFGLAGQAESEDDMWSYYLQAEEDYYVALDFDEMMADAYEALSEVYLAWDEWENALDILESGYEVTGERKLSEKAATVRDRVTAGNEESATDLSKDDTKENDRIADDEEDSIIEEEMPVILAVESGNTMMEGSKPIYVGESGYLEQGDGDSDYVFNTDIPRKMIRKIEFLDHLDEKPSEAWDISAAQDGSVWIWFTSDSAYEKDDDEWYTLCIAGDGGVDGNTDCSCLFYGYANLESIEFNHCFYTGNVTDMSFMFYGCGSLKELNLNCFDTSNVTNMEYMLSVQDLEEKGVGSTLKKLHVDNFDTSKVTDMRCMFLGCVGLQKLNVGSFNTSQVTDMSNMFCFCQSLEELDLNHFDTSQVTDMSDMFYYCDSMKTLDVSGFETARVTDMGGMFGMCYTLKVLNVSGFDTSQVTDMSDMFWGCSSIQELDLSNFDTSQVVTMSRMFGGCNSLEKLNIDSFNTSQVINMQDMFNGCSSLQNLNLDALDMTNVSNDYDMFENTQWE